MSKIVKKLFKSLLLSSALSLIHTQAKAQNPFLPEFNNDDDNTDEVGALKRKIMKNVVKVSPTGRMTMVDGHYSHRSHSSHRSHYSGSRSHSSHSSHYSSSSSSYSTPRSTRSSSSSSSSTINSLYSAPKAKTAADYSLGDRTIKAGIYGADVKSLADLLVSKYYLKQNQIKTKSGYPLYDANMQAAVKHFQKDFGIKGTGIVDETTQLALQTWDKNKTTIELGFRDLTEGVSGFDVTTLIKLLTAAGYAPDPNKVEYKNGNAVFNNEIITALKMFQAYNNLEPTGLADVPTIAKLKSFKKK